MGGARRRPACALWPVVGGEAAAAALAELRAAGVPAVLVVAGGGPLRPALQAEAAERGLPVRFAGHLRDRAELAALLATAGVALAPGPIETFGLAALPEVIGTAGLAATSDASYGAAVRVLLERPDRRLAARAQAERFPRSASVAGLLSLITADRVEHVPPG